MALYYGKTDDLAHKVKVWRELLFCSWRFRGIVSIWRREICLEEIIVAKDMALSKRTLQRKLSDENTTFVKQLNHTRELMAKNFLMNSVLSTDEVAYLLGYSDMYVFMRAFRQWTGVTVKQFRVKHGVV